MNNEFTIGIGIGIIKTILGYPLDTIKTNYQNNPHYKITMKNIYNGVKFPLTCNVVNNSLMFYLNTYIQNIFNKHYINAVNNNYISGFITGTIISPIINIFDLHKIQYQTNNYTKLQLSNLGISSTLMKESIYTSLYFGTFHKLKEYNVNPYLNGGITGTISWLCIYPIDVIKTRIQSKKYDCYYHAFRCGNLWKGISICLSRSFIINSISLPIYDYLQNCQK